MVSDPYKVLGVPEGADKDTIKKAYRTKVKECHPDLHPDDPNATQKMNELNEAYDMAMNPDKYARQRAYQQSSGGYSSYTGNPYGGYYREYDFSDFDFSDFFGFGNAYRQHYDAPNEQANDSDAMRRAINFINERRSTEALQVLNGIPSTERTARWFYVSAIAHYNYGNRVQAQEYIRKAVQMDPNEILYRQMQQRMGGSAQYYSSRGSGFDMNSVDMTKFCLGLIMVNVCCNGPCGNIYCC